MSAEPKTARGRAVVDAAREMADAAERAAIAYEHGSELGCAQGNSDEAAARAELDRLVAEWEVLSGPAFEAAALSGSDSIALLVRALHERAQQAESTRDAAQARATACEGRARMAEAERDDLRHGCHAAYAIVARLIGERDEWRAVAEEGAAIVRQTFPADTQIGRWAAAAPIEDPAAGTGDHEREPGRMGE